ncbi:MAG: GAP family protein [Hamadaea sp.]|nr:GAP family protein [Hamadaea sp.]
MDLPLLGSLAVLALIDSTSFGTLLIPIWLLLHPGRIRPGRILVFLGTVAAFYFAVGVAIALGADAYLPQLRRILDTPAALWTQLVLGVALFFWSFRMDKKKSAAGSSGGRPPLDLDPAAGRQPADAGRTAGRPQQPSRMARWRERAMTDGNAASLAGLALTAAAAEVTTMLPYLAAIGLLTTSALAAPQIALVMGGYCLLMIAPALVLLMLRLTAGHRIEPLLRRISDWMAKSNAVAWIVGIVGFLLARDAAVRLDLIG